MPGSHLGVEIVAENKTDKNACPSKAYIRVGSGETDNKNQIRHRDSLSGDKCHGEKGIRREESGLSG